MKDKELKIGMEVVINETVRDCIFGTEPEMISNIGKRVIISKQIFFDEFGSYGYKIVGDFCSYFYEARNFSLATSESKIVRWIDGVEYELIPTGRTQKTLEEEEKQLIELV